MPMVASTAPALTDLRNGARRIAVAYIAIGLLWITCSDALFRALVVNGYIGAWAETLKGYGYVLITGYLLYWAILQLHQQHRYLC